VKFSSTEDFKRFLEGCPSKIEIDEQQAFAASDAARITDLDRFMDEVAEAQVRGFDEFGNFKDGMVIHIVGAIEARGDKLLEINDTNLDLADEFEDFIREYTVGQALAMVYWAVTGAMLTSVRNRDDAHKLGEYLGAISIAAAEVGYGLCTDDPNADVAIAAAKGYAALRAAGDRMSA